MNPKSKSIALILKAILQLKEDKEVNCGMKGQICSGKMWICNCSSPFFKYQEMN